MTKALALHQVCGLLLLLLQACVWCLSNIRMPWWREMTLIFHVAFGGLTLGYDTYISIFTTSSREWGKALF